MDQLQWKGINKNHEEKRNILKDLIHVRPSLTSYIRFRKRPYKVVKTKK
jgi:hypothetical protein